MEKIKVLISWSGNNYAAITSDVNGAVIVTAATLEKVKKEFQESLKFHIDGLIADGDEISNDLKNGNYELDYEMHISAILHDLDKIVTRSALSRVTGINERQLGHYLSGYRNPRSDQRKKILTGIHEIGEKLISVV
jgi:predicted RNase H-like HicB family nuclease